ncbi:MAG: SGNH/GDSL hydrolase family protein, partial [Gammaproteobacteria bacterium]
MGAGIVAAFAVAEIVIRVAGLAPTSFYTYDRGCGWTTKPDTAGWQMQEGRAFVRINQDGFRGPDYALTKPPDTLRIAVLGDSFTEAQQVAEQDTFCAVAQRRIQSVMPLESASRDPTAVPFKRVEVMNFGCDGYGTAQELITLRERVWRYAPDVVVLAVFTGNDIRNNSVVLEGDKCRPFYVFDGPNLVLGGPFEDSFWFRTNCMLRFESRHLQVLNMLGDANSVLRHRIRAEWASRQPALRQPTLSEPGLDDAIYQPPPDAVWREAWRVTDAEIGMVQRDVAEHHARLLVVTLANGIQDDPDSVARRHYIHFVGAKDLFLPDDHIRDLGSRTGFEVSSRLILYVAALMAALVGA